MKPYMSETRRALFFLLFLLSNILIIQRYHGKHLVVSMTGRLEQVLLSLLTKGAVEKNS
jgi:hypothetical protein